MVHALQEAWRVLVPQGILVDLRPYTFDAPLEIVFKDRAKPAGLVDASLGRAHDQAADKAFGFCVRKGIFKELKSEYFNDAYYWKSVKGMVGDVNKRWKDDVLIPQDVLYQAFLLYKKHPTRSRVRLWIRMK